MTREEAIDILVGVIATNSEEENEALDIAIKALQEPEIVRCGDCRHAYYADNRVPHEKTWVCERFMNDEITSNDFCSWGEKKQVTGKVVDFTKGDAMKESEWVYE